MIVDDFIWDSENEIVSWKYNGKTINKKFENGNFASLNKKENFVYVEVGPNFSQEKIYYLSFEGEEIFLFDKLNNKISWYSDDRLIEIKDEKIVDARFYIQHEIIITVISNTPGQINRKIKGFSLDGSLMFTKKPPEGHIFMYLSTTKNQPSVVCDGGEDNADSYGRSRWHFAIDIQTGELSKENLAY